MLPLTFLFRRGLGPLLLLLGLAQAATAQAPAFDLAVECGSPQSTSGNVSINTISTDNQGNVFIAGDFEGSVSFGNTVLTTSDSDAFVAKRSAAGTWLWAASGGGTGYDSCLGVALDSQGQVYVTGYIGYDSRTTALPATFGSTTLSSTGGADVLVAKLDGNSGQWLWATSAGARTANNKDEQGTALALDALGGVLLTGTFADFRLLAGPLTLYQVGTGTHLFVARLDAASGAWAWATTPGPATPTALAADALGNAYLSGSFTQASLTLGATTLTNPRAADFVRQPFVARLSPTGSWAWAVAPASTPGTSASYGTVQANALAVDAQDHLYLAGGFDGTTASFGPLTLLNASTTFLSPGGFIRLRDAFVARLSASTGTWQWAVRTGGADAEYLSAIALRGGQLVVGGGFGRNANYYDPGTPSPSGSLFGTTPLVSAGKFDAVVAGLSADTGTWQWAVRAGSSEDDRVPALTFDAAGRVSLVGRCDATAQFGSYTVGGRFSSNILARLAGGLLPTASASQAAAWALYPNPAREAVTLSGLPPHQPVQVLDALGRLVLTARTPAQGALLLPLPPTLPPGLYVLRAAGQARSLIRE